VGKKSVICTVVEAGKSDPYRLASHGLLGFELLRFKLLVLAVPMANLDSTLGSPCRFFGSDFDCASVHCAGSGSGNGCRCQPFALCDYYFYSRNTPCLCKQLHCSSDKIDSTFCLTFFKTTVRFSLFNRFHV